MLRVQIDGFEEIDAALKRIEDFDKAPVLEAIGDEVKRQTLHRLEFSKRDPQGRKWKAWSPSYRRKNPRGGLLEGSGQLERSIEAAVFGNFVDVGSTIDRTHQGGRGQIPARPYLGIGPDNEDDIEGVVEDSLRGVLQEAGLL